MTFLIITAVIAALILLASYWAYRIAFYYPKSKHVTADDPLQGDQYQEFSDNISRISGIMRKIPCEDIVIFSDDGLKLHGRYYHVANGAPLEILFHGYKSHPFRDCSGGHALSRKMGFNALVIDQRAHGDSEGNTISFGIRERCDALCWIQYACNRFGSDTPIILSGLSMGAATVLMAGSLELPENVAAIIADSPYSSPAAIIEKVGVDNHYPMAICRPFLYLGAFIFGRFNLNEVTAKDAVSKCKIPILLIHGEDDRFVPCEMSREIAAKCVSRVDVKTFPEAGHGLCYMVDPKRYEHVVYNFLNSIPSLTGTIRPEFVTQLYEK